ncbi:NucA/NucB deoxyribonuclease domain-containing protein [Streptomyces sp. NRRL F-5630]|uniref:NucA/NucB deoxyribonuclease domain-containing protein n=1 Tax=Streptomyces sp. NRRL F-5630 TaxID=1463864 RepID=UPI003EBE5B66
MYPGKKNADTCDEFPPASTAEGGQDQSLCAELTPKVDNGVWSAPATWPERPATGAETCLRLHVTGRANYSGAASSVHCASTSGSWTVTPSASSSPR